MNVQRLTAAQAEMRLRQSMQQASASPHTALVRRAEMEHRLNVKTRMILKLRETVQDLRDEVDDLRQNRAIR
jgi:hypothetical protein